MLTICEHIDDVVRQGAGIRGDCKKFIMSVNDVQQPRENKDPSSCALVPIHPFASKQGGNVTWTSWLPGSYKPTDQRPAVSGIDNTASGHSTLLS